MQGPASALVGRSGVELWGLSQGERWRRLLTRAGAGEPLAEGHALPTAGRTILVRADCVVEDTLVQALVRTPDVILTVVGADGERRAVAAHVAADRAGEAVRWLERGRMAADERPEGLRVLRPEELGSPYNHALRKRAVPYVLSLSEDAPREIERRMFAGAYKGVTDFVTKWIWPVPARWATAWAARRHISANAVTWASLAFVLIALWRFAVGDFLGGLACAWIMTFLDTVDGKLARVTLTSSRAGDALDHGIDLLHPPFWYAAWWYGLEATGAAASEILTPALWIIVAGYLAGRAIEGLFIWRFAIEMHAWRPLDSRFRLFTARRNPNLALLTLGAVLGRADMGFLAVALWTVLSLLFHSVRLAQAAAAGRHGAPVRSWLAEGSGPGTG